MHATSMSDHPLSTGSPPIPGPSSSLDSNLLSPPTSTPIPTSVFYSQLTPNHPLTPPPNAFISTSTPISNKTSGNHSYTSETHDRDSANYCLAQETSGYFLGMMPPWKFLKKFLAIDEGTYSRVFGLRRSFQEHSECKERSWYVCTICKQSSLFPHLMHFTNI